MKLPKAQSGYPGDPVTDHDELIDFLRAQQDQINALGAAIEQLIASSFFDKSPHSPESQNATRHRLHRCKMTLQAIEKILVESPHGERAWIADELDSFRDRLVRKQARRRFKGAE